MTTAELLAAHTAYAAAEAATPFDFANPFRARTAAEEAGFWIGREGSATAAHAALKGNILYQHQREVLVLLALAAHEEMA